MELPNSKRELFVEGSRFVLRLPNLYLSYSRSRPFNVSPLSVDINITDRCNFKCKHCRGTLTDYKSKEEIDFTTMRKIIDDMRVLSISEMGHFLNRTLWHNQVALTSSMRPWL